MDDSRTILILSVAAAALLVLVLIGLWVSPVLGFAIGPVLIGIAAVIRAVRGNADGRRGR